MEIDRTLTNSIIDERYQLQELLGEGGSGSTYRAIRLFDESLVAIKILSLRHLNDWKQLELFEREAQVLAQLHHPQIPKYLDYFHVDTPDNRAFYIVQQLAPGKPLTAWVESGWRATEAEVQDIARQLLAILQYLHQQSPPLIHRDLKPHNIVRNDDGQVFLVDFGAVQNVYHNTLLKGSTVAGTYGYMAPEQFRGLAVPASDLYGLGATILYLLTHRSPAELPQERLQLSFRGHVNISNHFAEWLAMMLEPDTVNRFPTAEAASIALQKKHRFRRVQLKTKAGITWKSMVMAAIMLLIVLPLINQYRYALLGAIGLKPVDFCNKIASIDSDHHEGYLNHGLDGSFLEDYLNHGGDVNVTVDEVYPGLTGLSGSLLHCVINRGFIKNETINELLRRGANPNVKDSRGESPLILAVKEQSAETVAQLINYGADIHTLNNNQSSLWHVLAWEKEITPRFKGYFYDQEKHRRAVQPIVQQLLKSKVDFNQPNNTGDTPLQKAIQRNNRVVIDVLLDLGVKPNLADQKRIDTLSRFRQPIEKEDEQ